MTNLFTVEGVGGAPKNVFRKLQLEGLAPENLDPANIQLLALPQGTDPMRYIDAIKNQFTDGKIGCFILYLGDDKVKIPREELTGKCSNNEIQFKGQRKWVTVYTAHYNVTDELFEQDGVTIRKVVTPVEISAHSTKGEAVEAAKTYAVENNCSTFIRLEKRLDENSGDQFIAEYTPQTKIVYDEKVIPQNRYLFFGEQPAQQTLEEYVNDEEYDHTSPESKSDEEAEQEIREEAEANF